MRVIVYSIESYVGLWYWCGSIVSGRTNKQRLQSILVICNNR